MSLSLVTNTVTEITNTCNNTNRATNAITPLLALTLPTPASGADINASLHVRHKKNFVNSQILALPMQAVTAFLIGSYIVTTVVTW